MEKENSTSSTSFRYLVVFYIALAVYATILAFIAWPRLKANLRDNSFSEHYAIWKEKESVLQETNVPVVLHSYTGDILLDRTVSTGRKDPLHYTLEALLQPLSGNELLKGCVSLIPAGTKLEGATYSEGYCFVRLSKEFLEAEDINAALDQMKKTLSISFDTESLVVLCEDQEFTR
ncbi:MAG: GerMN domain-containing protein [Spirochaetales bacterium]|nr:GerMN domain-containing protein [Candidatus Physcosoma equi]